MTSELADEDIRRGEAALLDGEWATARAAFEESLSGGESAEALEGLARALWWLADSQGAISAWERAYATLRRSRRVIQFLHPTGTALALPPLRVRKLAAGLR